MKKSASFAALVLCLFCLPSQFSARGAAARVAAAVDSSGPAPVLLNVMEQELKRAMGALSKADPAPYYLSYAATDKNNITIVGSHGALMSTTVRHTRMVDVSVRVAGPELDNTHGESRGSGIANALLPLNDDPDAIARVLWQTTDKEYKTAARAYLQVKTNTAVRAQEEDTSADFSREQPESRVAAVRPPPRIDVGAWEQKLRKFSAVFRAHPDVYGSSVTLVVDDTARYFVSSEGSRIVSHRPSARLIAVAETRANDGMELLRSENFDDATLDRLPSDAEVMARIEKMAGDLEKLRVAPVVEPYNGPALLSGRAAAVFFHEVLGHRVEGHRQRGIQEGQTFTKKLNQQVLPAFLSVVDDPTVQQLNGVDLSGSYDYDEEGVRARKVEVVRDGVLKDFLLSRLPIHGFENSNGHGRGEAGMMPVGRQGNLIVSSTQTLSDSQLRARFIEELKKQNKPYGLYFEDIAGGFTLTTRQLPQAFQILPLMVWRVYADGRPDELVRGVDIVGTPLAALTRIIAAGDKQQVFNGVCGAESGAVPVAAVAPALLFSEIEVQKRRQTQDRPPILPAPGAPVKKAGARDAAPTAPSAPGKGGRP
ncbi:MAG TPA: metallopeptidase TldD-related protein [Terriglobales bacterium]|nr:metallopeptidase TldD-related protein [Terriglobales bacterium]